MEIKEYRRPASVEEAYALLSQSRKNCILAGCTFLRKTRLKFNLAIDLTDCGLNYILETEGDVRVGAYTCLRDMELSDLLRREFGDVFNRVFEHLIGVQLRSHITLGGHVYSRFGFSDLIPVLLSLNARVVLHRGGEQRLEDFMRADVKTVLSDILTEVILPKEGRRAQVQMARNSFNDYSLFCLAVSRAGDDWIIAGGVRPARAALAHGAMERLRLAAPTPETAADLAEGMADELCFGTNSRASAEYRRRLCAVFARRALLALSEGGGAEGED